MGSVPSRNSMVRPAVEGRPRTAAATRATLARAVSRPAGGVRRVDVDQAVAGPVSERSGAQDGPVQARSAQVGVRGGLGLGVGEEAVVLGDAVIGPGAEVGHHDVAPDAGLRPPRPSTGWRRPGPRRRCAPGFLRRHRRTRPRRRGSGAPRRFPPSSSFQHPGPPGWRPLRRRPAAWSGLRMNDVTSVSLRGEDPGQFQSHFAVAADDCDSRHGPILSHGATQPHPLRYHLARLRGLLGPFRHPK